jgi:hypothetical protein
VELGVLIGALYALLVVATRLIVPERAERAWLLGWVSGALVVFLLALVWANDVMPFTDGGDDAAYYDVSLGSLDRLADWFDPEPFYATHAQAGYPLFLTWIGQLVGDSLPGRKVVNVFWLMLMAVLLYDVGRMLGGVRLGRLAALGLLWLPSFWFYWSFLLKDMSVAFLQVLFLWGLVRNQARGLALGSTLAMVGTTVALLSLRSFAAATHVATGGIAVAAGVSRVATRTTGRILGATAAALLVAGAVQLFATDILTARHVGIGFEDRVLTPGAVAETTTRLAERQGAGALGDRSRWMLFPVLFVIGEVTAFSPQIGSIGTTELRGLLEIPWILVGAPFFLAGVHALVRRGPSASLHRAGSPREPLGLWAIPVAFLGVYAIGTLLAGDTTRWRLPALPAMVLVAGLGVVSTRRPRIILAGWWAAFVVAWLVYYGALRDA